MLNDLQANKLQSVVSNQARISSFILSDLLAPFLILIIGFFMGLLTFLIEINMGTKGNKTTKKPKLNNRKVTQ